MEFNFENYKCFEFSDEDENIQEEVKEEKDIFESSLEEYNPFKKIEDFFNSIKHYDYGFFGIDGKKYVDKDTDDEKVFENYRTMDSDTINKYQCMVCWDAVRMEAEWFKKNVPDIPVKCYYCEFTPPQCNTHTWLTFQYEGDWYIFEVTWKKYQGISKIMFENWIKEYVKNIPDSKGTDEYVVFEYDPLSEPTGLTTLEFMNRKWGLVNNKLSDDIQNRIVDTNITNITNIDDIPKLFRFNNDIQSMSESHSNELTDKLPKGISIRPAKESDSDKMYVMKLDKRFQIRSERFQELEIGLSLSFNEDYRYIVDSSVDLILEAKHRKHRGGTPKTKLSSEEKTEKFLRNAASKISIYNPNQKRDDNTKHLKNKNLIEAFIRNFNAQKIKDNPSMEIFDSYKINLSGIDVCCQIEMDDKASDNFKGSIAGGIYTHKYEVYIDKDRTKTPYNCIYVYLTPEFFRLSYNSQLSALYHEIGHYMMQNKTERENMSESDKIKQKNFYKHAEKYIDGIHDKGEHEIEADHFAANHVGEKKYNKLLRAIISRTKKDIYKDLYKKEKERLIKEIKENPNNLKIMELKLKEFKGLTDKNTISKNNLDQFINNYIDELLNSIKPEFHKAINKELDIKDVAQRLRAIYNKKLRTLAKYGNMEYHNESYKIYDIIELWNNTDIPMDEEVRYFIND